MQAFFLFQLIIGIFSFFLMIAVIVTYFQMASDIRVIKYVNTEKKPGDSKMVRWLMGDEAVAREDLFTVFMERVDHKSRQGALSSEEYQEELDKLKREFANLDLELDAKTLKKIATIRDYNRLKHSSTPFHNVKEETEAATEGSTDSSAEGTTKATDVYSTPYYEVGTLVFHAALQKQMRITSVNEGKYRCHTNNGTNYEGEFTYDELRPF